LIFILKIKGTDQIPDFVQIRDEDMTLRAYFRLDQKESGIKKNKLENNKTKILQILDEIPFGIIKSLDIKI
jgi:hypothetical protein